MQVPQHPQAPYWGDLERHSSTQAKDQIQRKNENRLHSKYAHVHALDGAIPPPQCQRRTRQSSAQRANAREKRFGVSDPAAWNAIQRTLAQQQRLSGLTSITPGAGKTHEPRRAEPPSVPTRSSSQRRTLNHFSKELEKYARVAGAAGKLPVITPTESDDKVSLHTIKPLLPYIDEFEAAGLAVTSEQQRPQSLRGNNKIHGPHEKLEDTSPSSSTGTIIEFTAGETNPTALAEPIVAPDKPTPKRNAQGKCRLPWLRKKAPEEGATEQAQQPTRVGTMVKVSRGEWRLADEEVEARHKASKDAGKRSIAKPPGERTPSPTRGPETAQSAKCPTAQRPSIIRPHILEYAKDPTCGPSEQRVPDDKENRLSHFEREMAQVSLPRPARGREQKKRDPPQRHHCPVHYGSPKNKRPQDATITAKSPFRPPSGPSSPAPKLPCTWQYVVSHTSSLQKALDAAAQKVEQWEAEADRPLPRRTRQHKHHPLLAKESCQQHRRPGSPKLVKEVQRSPGAMLAPPQRTASQLQETLSDLDVFFDSDDAAIDDRDVLEGLQVAVRAAADDLYDALIRNRTGMRIRRFLSDLKSIDVFDAELAATKRARPGFAERKRKLEGPEEEDTMHVRKAPDK